MTGFIFASATLRQCHGTSLDADFVNGEEKGLLLVLCEITGINDSEIHFGLEMTTLWTNKPDDKHGLQTYN